MTSPARRFLPVLLVLLVVAGFASAVGAQIDPVPSAPRAVWAASCVSPGSGELVVYGRGWASAPVSVEVVDQAGSSVGGGSTPVAAGRFQTRVALSVPAGASSLQVKATQGGSSEQHQASVSGSCSPSISAVAGSSCVATGQPVVVDVTVRGAPAATFDRVVHHADLYGPAETINRSQPPRSTGEYATTLTVANVPSRVVPVTVEAQRPDGGGYAFATTTVGLPPACSVGTVPTTTPSTSPATTSPATSSSTTTPPPGAVTSLPPLIQPSSGAFGVRPSMSLVPALGPAGQATTVVGTGFTPSASLTLRWRPGIGTWSVRPGGDGSFRTQVLVLPNDLEGPRSLEVIEAPIGAAEPAAPAATTSAGYLVVPASGQPAFGGVFLRG